jgi:hypothetical protein
LGLTAFAAINSAARIWPDLIANVQIHSETKRSPLEPFAEEKGRLRPLPAPADETGWRDVPDSAQRPLPRRHRHEPILGALAVCLIDSKRRSFARWH